MDKLDKNLVARIRKLVMNDSRFEVIDFDTHSEYWLAIVVEDEYSQGILQMMLHDVVENGYNEAIVSISDYDDYSEENPCDLDPCTHDWKVVYVISADYEKKRRLYGN